MAGREAGQRAQLAQVDRLVVGAVVVVAVEVDTADRELSTTSESDVATSASSTASLSGMIVHQLSCQAADERGRDDPAAVGVEGGDADGLVAHDLERRHRLDALDHHGAGAGAAVDQVDVDPAPPDATRARAASDRRPTATRWATPSCRAGRPRPPGRGPGRCRAGARTPCASSRARRRAPRPRAGSACRRTPSRREPTPPTRPGCRRWCRCSMRPGVDVDDVQGRALVAVGRQPVGHEPAAGRGVVPVDGGGRVAGQGHRVDQAAGHAGPQRGAHHEDGLVVVAPALEREHPVALDRAGHRRAGPQQRAQPVVQLGPAGQGVEHRRGCGRSAGRPRLRTSGSSSASSQRNGSATSVAVDHVDELVAPGGRWRAGSDAVRSIGGQGRSRLSPGRRWACGRGWPSCGGR